MKKFLTVFIIAAMLVSAAGCGVAAGYSELDGEVITLSGHSGYDNHFGKDAVLIKSFGQFQEFLSGPKLDGMGGPFVDMGDAFKETIKKYGEKYFSGHYLVFIADWQGSGSIQLSISGVKVKGDTVYVTAKALIPEIGTCDMRLWMFFVEIDADPNVEFVNYQVEKIYPWR